MELGRLHNQEILSISDSDIQNILEYKISRTEVKRLILEIKMDISNSLSSIRCQPESQNIEKEVINVKIDGSAYYPRLEAEMILRHVTRLNLKDCIKLKYNTLCKKVNGNLRFSLDEAIRIQETFFSDISINQLFRHD